MTAAVAMTMTQPAIMMPMMLPLFKLLLAMHQCPNLRRQASMLMLSILAGGGEDRSLALAVVDMSDALMSAVVSAFSVVCTMQSPIQLHRCMQSILVFFLLLCRCLSCICISNCIAKAHGSDMATQSSTFRLVNCGHQYVARGFGQGPMRSSRRQTGSAMQLCLLALEGDRNQTYSQAKYLSIDMTQLTSLQSNTFPESNTSTLAENSNLAHSNPLTF